MRICVLFVRISGVLKIVCGWANKTWVAAVRLLWSPFLLTPLPVPCPCTTPLRYIYIYIYGIYTVYEGPWLNFEGAGIAQWLEHRTRDWKVAGSNPCRSGGRIFFSRVDFLCWLLFRYPFHPRVTPVARKKSRSFCQKCRWQVTAKTRIHLTYVDFIEPCFGIGHSLSLICQMTSEDIKHQLIIIIRGWRGAGIAQWLEHRTRDWKVAGSNPCWNGGRIFFSRVDFLCWLLFRYPFHPRVTAVARKKSRSFCQKCRWQVTAKHAYTLRMWILLNRASALVTTCP